MKHSNLYLGLVLPTGGWQSLIKQGFIHLSMEEVTVHAGDKVSTEVDDNMLLIVGNSQWILDQHLQPHPIH